MGGWGKNSQFHYIYITDPSYTQKNLRVCHQYKNKIKGIPIVLHKYHKAALISYFVVIYQKYFKISIVDIHIIVYNII